MKLLQGALLILSVVVASVRAAPLKDVFAALPSIDVHTKIDVVNNLAAAKLSGIGDLTGNLFYVQETTSASVQYAAKEYEGPVSQVVGIYDKTQNKYGAFKNAEPIVDHIDEKDKYGNSGDKFQSVGRLVVNGMEALSNLINKIFEGPRQVTRQISKSITEKLNGVGGKLVGLS